MDYHSIGKWTRYLTKLYIQIKLSFLLLVTNIIHGIKRIAEWMCVGQEMLLMSNETEYLLVKYKSNKNAAFSRYKRSLLQCGLNSIFSPQPFISGSYVMISLLTPLHVFQSLKCSEFFSVVQRYAITKEHFKFFS